MHLLSLARLATTSSNLPLPLTFGWSELFKITSEWLFLTHTLANDFKFISLARPFFDFELPDCVTPEIRSPGTDSTSSFFALKFHQPTPVLAMAKGHKMVPRECVLADKREPSTPPTQMPPLLLLRTKRIRDRGISPLSKIPKQKCHTHAMTGGILPVFFSRLDRLVDRDGPQQGRLELNTQNRKF